MNIQVSKEKFEKIVVGFGFLVIFIFVLIPFSALISVLFFIEGKITSGRSQDFTNGNTYE